MAESAKMPLGLAWDELPSPLPGARAWQLGRTCVLSSLAMMELPRGGVGPTWLISISRQGRRPQPDDIERALRAFGMVGAEEDNHHPGNARHFFMPVDPSQRVDCECKATETVIADTDGYTWTNPKDGPCRGCELQASLGKPCPLHSKTPETA
jgi:hypothetical protein